MTRLFCATAQATKNPAIADGVNVLSGDGRRQLQPPQRLFKKDLVVLPIKNIFLLANGKINGPGKGQAKNIQNNKPIQKP